MLPTQTTSLFRPLRALVPQPGASSKLESAIRRTNLRVPLSTIVWRISHRRSTQSTLRTRSLQIGICWKAQVFRDDFCTHLCYVCYCRANLLGVSHDRFDDDLAMHVHVYPIAADLVPFHAVMQRHKSSRQWTGVPSSTLRLHTEEA